MGDLVTFDHLSRVLTGERLLTEPLVAFHLARLRADADAGPRLGTLLDLFARRTGRPDFDEDAFRQEVSTDPELGPLVRRIVVLWITGTLPKVGWIAAT
jgi:hypothetical protein